MRFLSSQKGASQMKANWKARNKQYNDRQKGEIFDVGIGYGLELASVVLNHYFGFGAKKIISA